MRGCRELDTVCLFQVAHLALRSNVTLYVTFVLVLMFRLESRGRVQVLSRMRARLGSARLGFPAWAERQLALSIGACSVAIRPSLIFFAMV